MRSNDRVNEKHEDDAADDRSEQTARPLAPARGEARIAAHRDMLVNRLRKNTRHLKRWARREGVECYRVYDRDIPEVPLSIDWYAGRVCLAARLRPDERDAEDHDEWMEALRGGVASALEVPVEHVYTRHRQRQKGATQYQPAGRTDQRFQVVEGGRRFWVNLSDYLDTGLFLDHRPLRLRVGAEVAGLRFLNLFSYTGAFTVHAGAGGAVSTTSVDLSATYQQWARDNLDLNDLRGPQHRLVRADALKWLDEPSVRGERFDRVVADPPTFSNSKRMDDVFDVQRDHPALLDRLAGLVVPGGVVYFSTNARRFRPEGALASSAEGGNVWKVEEITESTIPVDFRDRKIHRAWRLIRGDGRGPGR